MRQFIFLYPLLELVGYVLFISIFSLGGALIFGLVTLILGFSLLRGRGLKLFTQGMRSGGVAGFQAFNLSMFAGVLLVMPGFITDVLGLLLLIPAFIQLISNKFLKKTDTTSQTHTAENPDQGQVIEGEYHIINDEKTDTP